nr:MAG TPA: hypothetical protein [Caudoviricetes sp.]
MLLLYISLDGVQIILELLQSIKVFSLRLLIIIVIIIHQKIMILYMNQEKKLSMITFYLRVKRCLIYINR